MKTYVISTQEELEAILSDIVAPQPKPRKRQEIVMCQQDEKDLYALALDAYAERYATQNVRFAEVFGALAKQERTGH